MVTNASDSLEDDEMDTYTPTGHAARHYLPTFDDAVGAVPSTMPFHYMPVWTSRICLPQQGRKHDYLTELCATIWAAVGGGREEAAAAGQALSSV